MLRQTAQIGNFLGAGLELVELVARAAMVHQVVGEEARPVERIQILLVELAVRQGQQGFADPVRMRGAAGDVDDR